MKKIKITWLLLMILLIDNPSCLALTKSELTVLNLNPIATVEKPEGYTSVQGGTTTDKYVITLFINQNENSDGKCAIMALNKKNYKKVRLLKNPIREYNFGHANDATYNSLTNELVILSGKKLNFLDLTDDKFTLTRTVNLEKYYHAVGYDEENDQYVLARGIDGGTFFEIRNNEFEIIRTFILKTNLTKQSLTVYKGNIYYVCYEAGRLTKYQSVYDGLLKRKENLIYVYNLKGEKQTIYYIPYSYKEVIFGEIENISFNHDKMLIQFNHAQKAGYFTAEYPKEVETKVKLNLKEEDNIEYTLYQDEKEVLKIKTKNNELEFNLHYTEEGTYQYTIQQKKKEVQKEETEMVFEEEELEKIKKPLEVTVYYDPVVNRLRATTNSKDLQWNKEYFYSKTELKKLQESEKETLPDTGIS